MSEEKKISVTVLLPAGRLPLDIMAAAHELAVKYDLGIYCSLAQNLRLMNVPESLVPEVKAALAPLGADFKGPGKFPLPRVCVGKPHCNLGLVDIEALNRVILARFKDRPKTKPKFKIALAACPLCCSGVGLTDIGVHATKKGYEVYVGGKGGPNPKVGRRIKRGATEAEVVDIIETLVEFHDRKTGKKQRMWKLLEDPEFPFAEV
ncbi:MAG: nitrite reductase [Desulfobulbaceae bacterium]|nr:MAG: nitrite reductase [Desulfobulbaceae bacterium]